MVRVLFEISLPRSSLPAVVAALLDGALGPDVKVQLCSDRGGMGCGGPAWGGDADWTPCRIALEAAEESPGSLGAATVRVKGAVVEACRDGGLEVFAIPANAQIGDEFHRFRDLLDVVDYLERR